MKLTPENEPVASVLVVPVSVIGDPANVPVIVFVAAKPEPDMITIEPASPLVGLREIEGVTVKVAIAKFEFASDALTVFPPAVCPFITLNVALKKPKLSVVTFAGIAIEPANLTDIG